MDSLTTAKKPAGTGQPVLMTEGNVFRCILLFSLPLIFGNFMQQMYNTVDSMIVGNSVGSNALAAVGASSSLIHLLIAFSQGAAVGAGVIISQQLGAKNSSGVKSAVHTAVAISVMLGVLIMGGGILLARPLLVGIHTPAEVLEDAVLYLQIYFGGVLCNVVYNMAAGILNAAGNSRRSLLYLGIASVTNIVLDIVFIVYARWGVAGAAIATDISQLVSCVLALRYLMKVQADYRVVPREIRAEKGMAFRIIRLGLPTGIQNMVISISNVLVQSGVNDFGTAAMAGFGAYMKVDGFNIMPVMSFSLAATTFVGQNFGARRIDRVKKGMWATLVMGAAYTLMTGFLIITFSEPVMRLFSQDPEVIAYGQSVARFFCPFYWMLSILHGLAGTVRGTGKTLPPMIILVGSMCMFRIFWIRFILPLFGAIEGVFVLYPVSWAVGLAVMVLYTWRAKWIPDLDN